MKKKLLVSFSGGETSAYMAYWVKTNLAAEYDVIYVFANTGEEKEETLQFVQDVSKHFDIPVTWVEAVINLEKGKGTTFKVVDFSTASRKGEPFKSMVSKYGIPNNKFKHCTRELKRAPIEKYARSLGWKQYYTAIGIRADEIDRISAEAVKKRFLYPLISDAPMTKGQINGFWAKMPFRLPIKGYEGNCKVCFKKSLRKLLTIARRTPECFGVFKEIEAEFETFIPQGRKRQGLPIRFYRKGLSVDDILDLSAQPFEAAEDDRIKGLDLDLSGGCTESCEVF